jgi:Tol biopolymer transport system component
MCKAAFSNRTVLFFSIVFLSACRTGSVPPPVTTAADRLVFVREWGDSSGIYTVSPAIGQPKLVKGFSGIPEASLESAEQPAWSPNGRQIAFSVRRISGGVHVLQPDLYVMNADGSGLAKVTQGGDPAWSPDGETLAFAAWHAGNLEIFTAKVDGSSVTRVTQRPGTNRWPAWSPDGSSIAFVSASLSSSMIHVMSADGSHIRQLTPPSLQAHSPTWSPDGKHIAFSGTGYDSFNLDIYIIASDGSDLQNISDHPAVDFGPAWSPDGSRLAFTSDRDGNKELYVIDLRSGVLRNLTNHPGDDFIESSQAWVEPH